MVNMTRTPLNRTEKLQNITNTQRTTTIVSALIYVNAALAEIDIAKASGFTVSSAQLLFDETNLIS